MQKNDFKYTVYPDYSYHFDDGEAVFTNLPEAIECANKARLRRLDTHFYVLESRCVYSTKE